MRPYEVLGKWYLPERVRYNEQLINPGGVVSLREPSLNEYFSQLNKYKEPAVDWHRDDAGHDTAYLMWSNEYPTEILLPNNTVFIPQKNEVVLIKNTAVEHRIPEGYIRDVRKGIAKPRWFIRQVWSMRHSERLPDEYEIELMRKQFS